MPGFRLTATTCLAAVIIVAAAGFETDSIPKELCSPFGSYPNPLHLTETDREQFAPVIHFPKDKEGRPQYRILDHTSPWEDRPVQLVSPEEHERAQQSCRVNNGNKNSNQEETPENVQDAPEQRDFDWYGVGRYDEDRVGMYESELFAVEDVEDQRTIHVGIDLDGPVGTPVHAFYHGKVHAVGYNPDLGDYGNVIVIKHDLPNSKGAVFALYGHLNASVVEKWKVGQFVEKSHVLGGMGAFWENGGWTIPHVHFQLSMHAPPTHDLPGAVAHKDRKKAMYEYPDPRYVLGALY